MSVMNFGSDVGISLTVSKEQAALLQQIVKLRLCPNQPRHNEQRTSVTTLEWSQGQKALID